MKVLTIITATILIALGLSAAHLLDEPDLSVAEKQQLRFIKAAKAICGDGAAFEILDKTTIQCFMHTGQKTVAVKVDNE